MKNWLHQFKEKNHKRYLGGIDFLKYIGPGLIVTVGFIDPGNWATNFAGGASFGYSLLWVISLSTVMLVVLQHNVAHLGIATGKCLSEAAHEYLKPKYSIPLLGSAVAASMLTSLAEILGGAIALNMLFHIPIKIGSLIIAIVAALMLLTNSYRLVEKYIISFVSVIGISFLYELFLVKINWSQAAVAWVKPEIPNGGLFVILSILGAIVMPHNLFLHSEVIQSRQINQKSDKEIRRALKFEFFDTLFAMTIGWAINSAMILLAASAFFTRGIQVNEMSQAQQLLTPLLGNSAGIVFAVALLMAGLSSTITSGMAGGSIFSGIFGESYNISDIHSRTGVLLSLFGAYIIILFINTPFQGLLWSQMLLSVQLPFTIFAQVYLTSSGQVMGKYANGKRMKFLLYIIAILILALNVWLLIHG
ncbi:MAG: Nramp family divalent metal transporter [Bacteroidales bacterium]|nr:Nramp family divalent metal transporter [Bacteroidales bacterium]